MRRTEQKQAFQKLKDVFSDQPVLELFSSDCEDGVHTDPSSVGLASILFQRGKEDSVLRPVMFYSRKLSEDEGKYHSYELEVLAIVDSLDWFLVYLWGRESRFVRQLWLPRSSRRLYQEWSGGGSSLQEFSFETVPWSKAAYVDALSRQ